MAGNFHFAPGKSFQQSGVHVHDLLAFQKDSFNVSHYSTSSAHLSRISITELVSAKEYELINHFLIAHHALLNKNHLINVNNVIQITHKINRLAFGGYFPGVVNPLDG